MRLLIAIAATAALTGAAFAADLGPVPAPKRQQHTQRYAPVPSEQDDYADVTPTPQAPTCPGQFAGGPPGLNCAGGGYGAYGAGGYGVGLPCGAGYGGYGYPGPVLAGYPYPVYGGFGGFGGFGRGFGFRHFGRR